jgi:hypothetical protein
MGQVTRSAACSCTARGYREESQCKWVVKVPSTSVGDVYDLALPMRYWSPRNCDKPLALSRLRYEKRFDASLLALRWPFG